MESGSFHNKVSFIRETQALRMPSVIPDPTNQSFDYPSGVNPELQENDLCYKSMKDSYYYVGTITLFGFIVACACLI